MLACVTLWASVELGLPSGAPACLWSALVLCALLALRSGAERAELSWRIPSVGVQQELEALKSPSPGSQHKDDCIQFCSVAQLCRILGIRTIEFNFVQLLSCVGYSVTP